MTGRKYNRDDALHTRVSASITKSQIEFMSSEFGFAMNSYCSFSTLVDIVRRGDFASVNHSEICWILSECGIERILKYEPDLRIFCAFLYIYCRIKVGGIGAISSFIYGLLTEDMIGSSSVVSDIFLFVRCNLDTREIDPYLCLGEIVLALVTTTLAVEEIEKKISIIEKGGTHLDLFSQNISDWEDLLIEKKCPEIFLYRILLAIL